MLFRSMESMSANLLGTFGNQQPLTPTLDSLYQLARRVHETGRVYAADMEDILQNQERIWQAASGILSRLAAIR